MRLLSNSCEEIYHHIISHYKRLGLKSSLATSLKPGPNRVIAWIRVGVRVSMVRVVKVRNRV